MILTDDYPVPGQLLEFGNLFFFTDPTTHVDELCWYLRQSGVTCFHVRGWQMRTSEDVFREFAAALQFPLYFGNNGGAFDECLSELSWQFFGKAIVIVIADAGQMMADDDQMYFENFITGFGIAVRAYSQPEVNGPLCEQRPAIPFHFVVDFLDNAGRARWETAGASLTPLDTSELRSTIADVLERGRQETARYLATLQSESEDEQ